MLKGEGMKEGRARTRIVFEAHWLVSSPSVNAMDRKRRPDASGKATTASAARLDAAPATEGPEGRPDKAPRPPGPDQPDATGPSSDLRPQDPPPVYKSGTDVSTITSDVDPANWHVVAQDRPARRGERQC